MPVILGHLDRFDGQRNATLAARTPDDVDPPPADALDQAGADGDVLFSPTAGLIGDRAGDASAVCRHVREPTRVRLG